MILFCEISFLQPRRRNATKYQLRQTSLVQVLGVLEVVEVGLVVVVEVVEEGPARGEVLGRERPRLSVVQDSWPRRVWEARWRP